jgi:hypothetical protein
VQCLVCGKEIGAFRLLRDREFCSNDHRRKYGDRLGKALHQIAEPEPAPAGIATFVVKLPVQTGAESPIIASWIWPDSVNAAQSFTSWPMAVGSLDLEQPREFGGGRAVPMQFTASSAEWNCGLRLPMMPLAVLAEEYAAAPTAFEATAPAAATTETPIESPAAVEATPAACTQWMRTLEAEPVFRFVQPVLSLEPAALSASTVRFAALATLPTLDRSLIPAIAQTVLPVPTAEPVSIFVKAAIETELAAAASAQLPALSLSVEAMPVPDEPMETPAACETLMRAPQAEPVWAFVASVAAAEAVAAPVAIALPKPVAALEPLSAPLALPIATLPPEPVFSFVQPAAALETLVPAIAAALPKLSVEIEPMEPVEELLVIPALCGQWMRAPQPEPVFAFVQSAADVTAHAAMAVRAPEVTALAVAGPHIPTVSRFRNVPQPEPVMAGVWPHVADIPFEPILGAAAIQLPKIAGVLAQPQCEPQEAVAAAAAEVAETIVCASRYEMPAAVNAPDFMLPRIAAVAYAGGAAVPQMAGAISAHAPEPLETLLTASSADQVKSATVVRLQPFAVAASEGLTVPGFDAPRLAPPAHQPPAAAAQVTVYPIATVHIAAPAAAAGQRPMPTVPQPGMLPLEFHAQRVRGEAGCKLEWKSARFAAFPPRFRMRPVWDKATEQIAQPLPKKSSVAEVFEMPEAKPKSSKWVAQAAKIAAGIVVVGTLWYGATTIKMDRVIAVRTDVPSVPAPGASAAAGSATTVARAAKPESKGAISRVRETIAKRAAVQVSDNLREGMEAWGAAAKTYPSGWSRSRDGYVNTGALALFNPTKNFTDYRMEFFGQIESKSMGWTVRAKDEKNYQAMKFTVLEAGLRPVIAMVHYTVVDGKAGKRTQTPLNVMMHNRKAFQVAVNVKGNHFTTSIDGEEVDSFMDDTLASGGVGFFSEAGEKARLYWVKVSKNDDWLGHICAFLSGNNGSQATAELWAPELPGSPAPWNPASDHASLAGAIALPYISASRRRGVSKSRRYEDGVHERI